MPRIADAPADRDDVMGGSRSASALGEYLWARRAVTPPESVGLSREGNRRVPGLRREEVARLASISPAYYLRLEQGHDREPSDSVLRRLAEALNLDADAEHHLQRLRGLRPAATGAPRGGSEPPSEALRLLAGFTLNPAFVLTGNLDVLHVNALAAGLGDGFLRPGTNLVEAAFAADPADAGPAADDRRSAVAAALRFHGDPYDPRFRQLVDCLVLRSPPFVEVWERHDARPLAAGDVRVAADGTHPSHAVFDFFEVPAHDGLLVAVSPELG